MKEADFLVISGNIADVANRYFLHNKKWALNRFFAEDSLGKATGKKGEDHFLIGGEEMVLDESLSKIKGGRISSNTYSITAPCDNSVLKKRTKD